MHISGLSAISLVALAGKWWDLNRELCTKNRRSEFRFSGPKGAVCLTRMVVSLASNEREQNGTKYLRLGPCMLRSLAQ